MSFCAWGWGADHGWKCQSISSGGGGGGGSGGDDAELIMRHLFAAASTELHKRLAAGGYD